LVQIVKEKSQLGRALAHRGGGGGRFYAAVNKFTPFGSAGPPIFPVRAHEGHCCGKSRESAQGVPQSYQRGLQTKTVYRKGPAKLRGRPHHLSSCGDFRVDGGGHDNLRAGEFSPLTKNWTGTNNTLYKKVPP